MPFLWLNCRVFSLAWALLIAVYKLAGLFFFERGTSQNKQTASTQQPQLLALCEADEGVLGKVRRIEQNGRLVGFMPLQLASEERATN